MIVAILQQKFSYRPDDAWKTTMADYELLTQWSIERGRYETKGFDQHKVLELEEHIRSLGVDV